MGCVNAKSDINELHPNIFQVANVNDDGEPIIPGQIQVTESELIYYQRGKDPTRWPLRSLRKYGYDLDVFSFECGRRCRTGEGIYAFKCRKAEQLFNMVQQFISCDTNPINNITTPTPNSVEFPIPAASTGPPVQRRMPSQSEGYLNPVTVPNNAVRSHPAALSRPSSMSSNGPVSPPAQSPPPIPTSEIPLERNNNKRGSLIPDQSSYNTSALVENGSVTQSYANLGALNSPTENYINVAPENVSHVYMNIDAKDVTNQITTNTKEDSNEQLPETEDIHCYANIDAKDIEHLRPMFSNSAEVSVSSVPQTPTSLYVTLQEVNYAELDLESMNNPTQIVPESPQREKKSYATIDFQKTNALSQSINPRLDNEEGSRKTRHNSTINDIPTRHSNSLSD